MSRMPRRGGRLMAVAGVGRVADTFNSLLGGADGTLPNVRSLGRSWAPPIGQVWTGNGGGPCRTSCWTPSSLRGRERSSPTGAARCGPSPGPTPGRIFQIPVRRTAAITAACFVAYVLLPAGDARLRVEARAGDPGGQSDPGVRSAADKAGIGLRQPGVVHGGRLSTRPDARRVPRQVGVRMRLSEPSGRRRRAPQGPAPERPAAPPRRGRAERRQLARRARRRRAGRAPRRIAAVLCGGILLTLLVKTFVVQAFVIPSGSMEPTLRVGDRVLADTFTRWSGSTPAPGAVVVFHAPEDWTPPQQPTAGSKQRFPGEGLIASLGLLPVDDGKTMIKRVVAVGGDTVQGDAAGDVRVNGVLAQAQGSPAPPARPSAPFRVTVPEGRLFVLGDNRGNSADSRYHLGNGYGGSIPEDSVIGEAFAVVWPTAHWRTV
ncbi:signal peptidase I [Streptomyces sp. NPDC006487]|uniref:signal peptidase I n=1 Tax=Streptomyces sp. NPDC006487 TaxID=3364748 RepID=UPI0036C737C6